MAPTLSATFAGMITIAKTLEYMHSGKPFSLKVVSYDKRRPANTGKVQHVEEAVIVWGDGEKKDKPASGERAMTGLEMQLAGHYAKGADIKRNPQHAVHYSRNIRLLQRGVPTEAIKKIHPPLIIEFNGETTCP